MHVNIFFFVLPMGKIRTYIPSENLVFLLSGMQEMHSSNYMWTTKMTILKNITFGKHCKQYHRRVCMRCVWLYGYKCVFIPIYNFGMKYRPKAIIVLHAYKRLIAVYHEFRWWASCLFSFRCQSQVIYENRKVSIVEMTFTSLVFRNAFDCYIQRFSKMRCSGSTHIDNGIWSRKKKKQISVTLRFLLWFTHIVIVFVHFQFVDFLFVFDFLFLLFRRASAGSRPLGFPLVMFCFRHKKITCVCANMPKKIRVGRSENLFIFCLIFVC